jgi:hypothetical protein
MVGCLISPVRKLKFTWPACSQMNEDKLFLSPYFIHLSNIKAWSKADEIIVLPNILDFGIDINMLFNYKIGAFLKIRNLLGKENQRYNLYSSREFDIYGGISVRF